MNSFRNLANIAAAAVATLLSGEARAQSGPTLIVQITIDQLRPDYLDKFRSQFSGGLARMLDSGAYLPNSFHDHAVTETAPGHATLWSGRHPSRTGIVLNEAGVNDPSSPLLFGIGEGASPFRFRGTSFFDWVHARDQNSRALSVSRKDRGAILPLGRAKQEVYWYSREGRFTTSRYYGDTVSSWVRIFNERDFTAKYLGTRWDLLLPPVQYSEPDSNHVENQGTDFVFPHILPADRATGMDMFRNFPWMDDVTVDFALAGVEAMSLGVGPSTDVLAISLSSTDAIGHAFGPDSRELHDQILRVDRALGRLIDSLYKLRDPESILFVLGSDHGVTPMPELAFPGQNPGRGRVDFRPVFESAWIRMLLNGAPVSALRFDSGIVTLDRRQLATSGMNPDSLVNALRGSLLRLPGVERVDRVSNLEELAATGDWIARRWFQSVPDDVNAELTVTMEEGYYFLETLEATHGSVYDLDARIPILFMGPGVKAGRYAERVRSVDIAPTMAFIAGATALEAVDGKVLKMILQTHH